MNDDIKDQAKKHWDSIAKPIASLGLLEDDIIRIAAIEGTADPGKLDISKRALLVFCADHGVVAEGVSQTDQKVTRQVAENFVKGKSSTNLLAKRADCDVYTVDIGMNTDPYCGKNVGYPGYADAGNEGRNCGPGRVCHQILNRKIARGTANLAVFSAMTVDQCQKGIETGKELVRDLVSHGYQMIAVGEMGIGNTTPTSCLASYCLDLPAEETAGRGAGLSDEGILKKQEVIRHVVKRMTEKHLEDPVEILAEAGGFELAGMTGAFLGAAKYHVPIIIDGAISAVSALMAVLMDPSVRNYLLASHASNEKTGQIVLETLGLEAMIHGHLALGEGSGAVMLMPLLDMAMDVYKYMGSFDQYGIESYERFGNEPDTDRGGDRGRKDHA